MATSFTIRQVFGLPPGDLFGLLGEPEVARRRATAVPDFNGELLALTRDDGPDGLRGLRMAVAATMPSSWLGGMAGTPRLIRTENWRAEGDGYAGDVDLLVEGLPVTCGGTTRLEPDGAGSALSMDLDLSVDVPMLGPMVEAKVADRIRAAMGAELEVLQDVADGR